MHEISLWAALTLGPNDCGAGTGDRPQATRWRGLRACSGGRVTGGLLAGPQRAGAGPGRLVSLIPRSRSTRPRSSSYSSPSLRQVLAWVRDSNPGADHLLRAELLPGRVDLHARGQPVPPVMVLMLPAGQDLAAEQFPAQQVMEHHRGDTRTARTTDSPASTGTDLPARTCPQPSCDGPRARCQQSSSGSMPAHHAAGSAACPLLPVGLHGHAILVTGRRRARRGPLAVAGTRG